ncbi:hypothetical protein ACJMK2_025433 [Sinanodonta woodiana]|uniref:Uncharacterized protein n=1 Tax=Sinanodonta woodiana TaxID=1069815 RepID=A0ABD3XGH6_SINWO
MQLFLALVVLSLSLWEQCIAICPDGSSSHLPCNPHHHYVCPEGYKCHKAKFPPNSHHGQCCLDRSFSDYTCRYGHPLGYGNWLGLVRCDGHIPNSIKCPKGYHCKGVEWTKTRIGICCPNHH